MGSTSLDTEEDVKESFEVVTPLCRGCLTTNRNMINAVNIESLFKDLTGINITESDGLPQWLCYECTALLKKAVRFKRKILKAHNILYQYSTRCAPFPIDAHDEELSKYASPYLVQTSTLICDITKGKNGICQIYEHEKQLNDTELDDATLLEMPKSEADVKEELNFSDYEDNITLEEFRSNTKITDDELDSLLMDSAMDVTEIEVKKKKRNKRKIKEKKNTVNDEIKLESDIGRKSSIRRTLTLDPEKIRIITLNPEEQIKQKEEEARTNLKFPFQCKLCHKGFNFEVKLENHMSKHSPSRGPFKCKLCSMYLPTSYSHSVHSLIHTRRYECVTCGRRMIDRASIWDHYRTQHEGLMTLFTCNLCGKVSNNNKTHRGHMRNHHGADRPKCDQCGKTFVNKDSLAEHIQIHQGIKNYECSTCGKRFRTRTQIKHHQLKHTDVKEFYCVECDVRFKSAHNLRQHLQKSLKHKDTGSFMYSCPTCDKRFESRAGLVSHERIQHEGVRPHVCAQCGAALATRASLAKHQRTVHAGTRPDPQHVCHTCGRAFRAKSVLTNHVRTHTGEKPYECTSCGRKFTQLTAMRTHVKLVHLKIRRQAKVKPEVPGEQLPPAPKIEVFKPEPTVEPWRQPCDVYFQVSVVPKAYS